MTRSTLESVRRRALVGVLAALGMGAAMLLARAFFAAPLPPDLLFGWTGRLLGVPWVFNAVHALPWGVDQYAKYVLFATSVVAYLAAFAVLGAWLRPRLAAAPFVRAGAGTALFAALSTALVGLVFLPLQGFGAFGLGAGNFLYPPAATHAWAAAFGGVFGAILALVPRPVADDSGRRAALGAIATGVGRGMALAAAAGLLGRIAVGTVAAAQQLVAFLGRIAGLSPEITPTEDHYVVSKNVFDPRVGASGWSLSIVGQVDNELTLTLDDLRALPSVERSSTLTCISNEVGGDLIGNSVWTGVRLGDLLETAGVREGANELILRAADNYSDSFPLDAALREGTIVAYLQNGEPLTQRHGFPARVLVPGIYGMKNVKWVVEIELTDVDHQGYWQTRGWSDSAEVQTMSRIDTPVATRLEDGSAAIGGVAFAGLRGIAQVEVSIDGGASWQPARVDPAENGLSWNLWGFRWEAVPGTYDVLVRATDGSGTTQTSERARPLPDGATGWHSVRVRVEG